MRVVRTVLGLLLLTVGIPALLIGAALWAVMQHRDAGGSFGGRLQPVVTPGYAVVVDDTDELLSADVPFARRGDTRLRLIARTADGPAFVGLAPTADVRRYLADVPRQAVRSVDIGTGLLNIDTVRVAGSRAPAVVPGQAGIWLKAGNGQLDWNPATLRGSAYSLVIMSPSAQPGIRLNSTAAVSPGWLNSSTWALLVLGSLAVLAGMIILAWPSRRREIVYVVEPSQVPDLVKAIGAPLPVGRTSGRRIGAHRPRTLADSSRGRTPAAPPTTWPPARRGAPPSLPTAAPTSPAPTSPVPAPAPAASATPASDASSPAPVSSPAPGSSSGPVSPSAAVSSPAPVSPSASASSPSLSVPVPSGAASATSTPSAASAEEVADPAGRSDTRRRPAPGEPLKFLGDAPSRLSGAAALLGSPGAALTPPGAGSTRPADRGGRRRASAPAEDTPAFEATAVGAWVAETAAARARETEARAAAILAAEASKHDMTPPGPPPAERTESDGGKTAMPDAPGTTKRESLPASEAADAPETATPSKTGRVAKQASRGAPAADPTRAEPQQVGVAMPAAASTSKPDHPADAGRKIPATSAPGGPAKQAASAATDHVAQPSPPRTSPAKEASPVASVKSVESVKPVTVVQPAGPDGLDKPAALAETVVRGKPDTVPGQPVVPAKQPDAAKVPDRTAPAIPSAASASAEATSGVDAAPAVNSTSGITPDPETPGGTTPAPRSPAAAAGRVGDPAPGSGTSSASKPSAGLTPLPKPSAGTPAPKIEAPVQVPLSDRPAAVGQPGHAVPPRRPAADGGSASPVLSGQVDVAPGSAAEVPRSTREIQTRLQAALRSASRPAAPRQASSPSKPASAGAQPGAQGGTQTSAPAGAQPGAPVGEPTGMRSGSPAGDGTGAKGLPGRGRSSTYAAEAAELLAGLSPNRRRRKPAVERLGPKPRNKGGDEPAAR